MLCALWTSSGFGAYSWNVRRVYISNPPPTMGRALARLYAIVQVLMRPIAEPSSS